MPDRPDDHSQDDFVPPLSRRVTVKWDSASYETVTPAHLPARRSRQPEAPTNRGGERYRQLPQGREDRTHNPRRGDREGRHRSRERDAAASGSNDDLQLPNLIGRHRGARRGDLIGERYLVEGQIGRGGMGRVMQVRHQALGKAFALKLIKAPIATDQHIREMFYREARLASSLSHENICSIVDFGRDDRFGLFMVMELLDGQTIFHRLQHKGRMAPKVACDVIWQVAEALRYIHERGIVHGDIKSENILLIRTPEQRRVVKLLDFGLARPTVGTQPTSIEGTPEYLAPERIRGQAPSKTTDIYALGMLFYELLAGELPFIGGIEDVFRMHLHTPVPRPSEMLDGALDERADELILRATAKEPQQRHSDVNSFMYELRTLMSMLGIPRRLRGGNGTESRGSRTRNRTGNHHSGKRAAEIFEYAPMPLASVNRQGRVRAGNHAFWRFLGLEDESGTCDLRKTSFVDLFPDLIANLHQVASLRCLLKRIIQLQNTNGTIVDIVVILSPVPAEASATAGEVHLAIHPLQHLD